MAKTTERDREGERRWAAEQLEWLRTAAPPPDYAAPVFDNEEEITHPPGERAILPFRLLSPGHADYLVFIDRWLARYKKQQEEKGRE